MKKPLSAKNVYYSITDSVSDTNATKFTGNPFINFWNFHYGGDVGAIQDLGFDEGSLTSADVPFTISSYSYRLEHVASDFTLTFASISTEKKYYMGTANEGETPNSYLDESDPEKATVAITITGAPAALEAIFMSAASSTPTGWVRYNGGSRPTARFGLVVGVVDNKADPDNADNIALIYYLNNCVVTDAGDIKASGNGNFERTLNIECDATDLWEDTVAAQNASTIINIS